MCLQNRSAHFKTLVRYMTTRNLSTGIYYPLTGTINFGLETYRSSLYHKHSVVRTDTWLSVSPKFIQYPYITQKTKELGESLLTKQLSHDFPIWGQYFCGLKSFAQILSSVKSLIKLSCNYFKIHNVFCSD